MSAYPNPSIVVLFADPTGCVTLFVHWIKDYPLPDGLKMPSHVGSYDGKGVPITTYTFSKGPYACKNGQCPQQKKFTKTHLAVHNIKQREGESTRAFATRYTNDSLQILALHEDQRIYGFVHKLRTTNLVEFLSTDLPTTYKGLMEKTYTWIEARLLATNGTPNDRSEELRHQIKESVKSGQPAQLVKGIKKGKAKVSNTQLGEWKKGEKDITPTDDPILMISRGGEHSWPLGEVPLQIIIFDAPFLRTKILDFVIVRSNYPHNLLLGRTVMQQMGIVLSTIHRAIKFHTPRGIGTVFLTRDSYKTREEQEKFKETSQKGTKEILSCVDIEERIVVNDKYSKQTIAIGK
ncbi:hypothetical protein Tco_0848119 [Tanacetum coccineum]